MRTLEKLNFDTKLSSAGLVYAHYGREVINQVTFNNQKVVLKLLTSDPWWKCVILDD